MSDLNEWRYRIAEISTQDENGADLAAFEQFRARIEVFRSSAPDKVVYTQWLLRATYENDYGMKWDMPYGEKFAIFMRDAARNIIKTLSAMEEVQAQVGQVFDVK